MTDEDRQRQMDFILNQQAQLTATVGRLSDTVESLSGTVENLSGTVERLSDKVDRTADSITALLAVAELQAQEIKDLGESVRAIDERQRLTDERLNALINTVERFISERRNGQTGKGDSRTQE